MKGLLIVAVFLAALITGVALYLQPNGFIGCGQTPQAGTSCDKADAIVVLSGGDTAARVAAGVKLYQDGWAERLIFSGAAFDRTGPSNAAAMRDQAVNAGVPAGAISIDEQALNTQQNAVNTNSIIRQQHIKDIILVTSGYHQRRADLEFERLADGGTVHNYPIADKDWQWYWWLTPRGWWLAGGELVKIVIFYSGVDRG